MFLLLNHLISPLATNWYQYLYVSVTRWELPAYQPWIQEFKGIVSLDVATQETIDVFSDEIYCIFLDNRDILYSVTAIYCINVYFSFL